MKIGIMGTGNMGSALGVAWCAQGYDIMFGSRDPEKARALAEKVHECSRGGSIAETAAFGDVVVLAVPWTAAQVTIHAAADLSGKILIDITNPIRPQMAGLAVKAGSSAAEEIAVWAKGAHVVKAFNSMAYDTLLAPDFDGQAAASFYCGDDQAAEGHVAQLSAAIGLDPVDCGPLEMARYLEPLAFLWISLAFRQGEGRERAFGWLRKATT